jgi:hypothetical protein
MLGYMNTPFAYVTAISVAVGFIMVIVFRYTSDQKGIARAKDRLKAHLLAVRLFQDQLPVVLRAYGRILLGTGSYLRLAFTPLLIAIVPIFFLMVHLDRYFGWMPVQPQHAFVLDAQLDKPAALDSVQLQLPPGLTHSSPPVHIPKNNEIVWRIDANREGRYDVNVVAGGQAASKQVVVSEGLSKLSPVRLRNAVWDRILSSSEPALPSNSPVQSISVNYPARELGIGDWQTNWMVWFFVLSLAAGFVFKSVLGIQV